MNKQEQQEYERIVKQNKDLQNELIYLRTYCKRVDETNRILYTEKIELLKKLGEL